MELATSTARLVEIQGLLLGAARAPSPHTVKSYMRRWRQWAAFAEFHGVSDLPADPVHVSAFVAARVGAGVSASTVEANLSAVRWVHEQSGASSEVCVEARHVLNVMKRLEPATVAPPAVGASVLSVGALVAMADLASWGERSFWTRVMRLVTGVRPRQLMEVRPEDVLFTEDGSEVVIELSEMPKVARHPMIPARTLRLVRGRHPLECPVRAMHSLVATCEDGRVFTEQQLFQAAGKGFDPLEWKVGSFVRQGVRDRALICVGYSGALRVEELAQLRVEDLEVREWGFRAGLRAAKGAGSGEVQHVRLERDGGPLDPVDALNDWLVVRGDADGPVFTQVHHRSSKASGRYEGMTAGAVSNTIKERALAVGVGDDVSGYSLRRSWATHAWVRDPGQIGAISAKLRHSRIEITTRYIEDLRLEGADTAALLDPVDVVAVGRAKPKARKNLGFVQDPLGELAARVGRFRVTPDSAPSTIYVDGLNWKKWCGFAIEHDVPIMPARGEHVAAFIAERAEEGLAPSTLASNLNAVRKAHLQHGNGPVGGFDLAQAVLEGHRRVSAHQPKRAPILSPDQLARMASEARDAGRVLEWAITTIGYSGALRTSDLWQMQVSDVSGHEAGLIVRFPKSKKNTKGARVDGVFLASRPDVLDPVAAFEAITAGRGSGPVLINQRTSKPANESLVRLRFKRQAQRCGIDPVPTVQSMRRSWATHAYESGLDVLTISRHLRHDHTRVTKGYIERLSGWVNNPAEHLAKELGLILSPPGDTP